MVVVIADISVVNVDCSVVVGSVSVVELNRVVVSAGLWFALQWMKIFLFLMKLILMYFVLLLK